MTQENESGPRRMDWWLAALQMAMTLTAGGSEPVTTLPAHPSKEPTLLEEFILRWADWFYDQIAAGGRTPR